LIKNKLMFENIFLSEIPKWFSLLFTIAFNIPPLLVALVIKKGAENSVYKTKANTIFITLLAISFVYLILVAIGSINGLFEKVTFPPKILWFTMFPMLAILFGLVLNSKKFKVILDGIPLHNLVRVHIFRLIGSTFLVLYFFNQLPKVIGMVAGIGDVLTAITCVFVAYLIKNRKPNYKKITWVWNTFGFVDIIATSALALILTRLQIVNGSQGVEALAAFPFCFIPAFAPAIIMFLHMCIYKKLKVEN